MPGPHAMRYMMEKMRENDERLWEEEKEKIKKLALAIKGSTKEEFPADLANLEDYIYSIYKNRDF